LARWILIPLAAAAGIGGVAVPAGASSSIDLAGTLANVVSLADSGNSSVCALLSTHTVDCWGYNQFGELGNGTTTNSDVPVPVLGVSGATAVAGDENGGGFCAVLSTGHVKCWGNNTYGELGNGTTTTSTVAVAVKNISTATAVFGSDHGFCALLSTSHVDCWGYGGTGQLGDGSFANSDMPVAVRNISNATTVTGGYETFCALLSTSHVDCWGYGLFGQLGDGSFASADVPVPVKNISTATALAQSGATSDDVSSVCALLASGTADCWGYNGSGQLGNGTTTASDVPVPVFRVSGAKAVAGDYNFSAFCVVLSTGHLKCWGDNSYGELGAGTTAASSTVPVPVKNISTATAAFGGQAAFCARLSTSHLDCWGFGGTGQLGDGVFTNSNVPVAVRSISNATTMISGYDSFCARLSTSHVDCWGSGTSGQLGDGSVNSSDVPVPVQAAS
jgi:alpha-tubulin suppressor-like RCC1 family protein